MFMKTTVGPIQLWNRKTTVKLKFWFDVVVLFHSYITANIYPGRRWHFSNVTSTTLWPCSSFSLDFTHKHDTHLCPFSKSKFNLYEASSLTASTLLHRLVLFIVCFITSMSVGYSTNLDRKGWPGSEIKMYYGCLWWKKHIYPVTY